MISNKKVALYTLGCKLNFAETSTIARSFAEAGYARVEIEQTPDVLVVNTCSVTDQADKKCRNIVRRVLGANPNAYVAVIGCYAQLKPEEIASIPGVDLVLGANEKFKLLDHIHDLTKNTAGVVVAEAIKETRDFVPSFSSGDRTRTFLKVQDGCNYFCAFCTIPLARGRSRSATIEETLLEAQKAAKAGAKEIVLTGVNIGDFGTAHNETLLELVQELDKIEGIERFRISSIEPNLLSNEIIEFVAQSNKFVPHFHIPLQSGSDEVLKSMRRRYLTGLYADRIKLIREVMPDACIGVDVIVGFPGESDAHFQETFDFLHQLDVSYFHVFTYSERANTTAVRIDDVIPMNIRQQRNKQLRGLSLKKKRAFYDSQLGTEHTVLFEGNEQDGQMHGFTENYVKVTTDWNPTLVNKTASVKLNSLLPDGIVDIAILTNTEA
ncbi:MAG: tRNA (N(6)-L-threonylcarbamoyladenosine(37)-C(2))-methylthiotransferase MtaB [Flavobacteriales bacterium]|nr:tRNA (N(6)-L-threonylcarbamoyladenosine(37)-C(2))-methylthiotransferase MtaB [Flavobacteriales bacterium]